VLVKAVVVWACVNRDFKAIPVSDDVKRALLEV
jgi:acyl-CoA thioesterase FadM